MKPCREEESHMSSIDIQIEEIYQASYLNLVNHVMQDLEIPQLINELVPYDVQCKISPGEVVQLMVLDILTGRQAIMHLEEWAKHIDLKKLISPDVEASYFNDDAIGRHLDRIYEANVHQIFSEITLQLWKKEGDPLRIFHSDTTSKSVYGMYPSTEEDQLMITEGYSRDRQGDKQFQYGMIVNQDGILVYGDVHNGNTSDKTWNSDVLSKLNSQLKKLNLNGFIYVADSAAMSKETLDQVKKAGGFLITRGSNNLKIVKEALDRVEQQEDQWSAPWTVQTSGKNTIYRVQELSSIYEGQDVRLIVVESSALEKKKLHTLEKQCQLENKHIQEAQAAFAKQIFHCEADAKEALIQWQKSTLCRFHTIEAHIEKTQEIKRKPGRPKKFESLPIVDVYRVVISRISRDEERFSHDLRRASRFVLVSTVPLEYQGIHMDALQILHTYKGQMHVEMNFSFIKDPYFADEVYLKKPSRVEVLGYILMVALLIYKVFQKKIRSQMQGQKPLRGAGKRKLVNPTAQAIFDMFEYVQVLVLRLPDGKRIRKLGRPLSDEQQRVLHLLGMNESVYL
jgi:transposase